MPRARRISTLAALVQALRASTRPGEAGLGTRLRAVPRWVSATLSGAYPGTSRGRLMALAAAALYVISPIDLVPEGLLPVIGLADDAVVVAWLAGQLLGEADGFLRWERSRSGSRARRSAAEDLVQGHVVR